PRPLHPATTIFQRRHPTSRLFGVRPRHSRHVNKTELPPSHLEHDEINVRAEIPFALKPVWVRGRYVSLADGHRQGPWVVDGKCALAGIFPNFHHHPTSATFPSRPSFGTKGTRVHIPPPDLKRPVGPDDERATHPTHPTTVSGQ